MPDLTQTRDRRTSVDVVFDHLRNEITSLRLRPGDKISEADIAAQFGVSRQPVRDAFSRLENLDLLLIRPQRATEIKRFSMREISKSRFVRAAVESEVLRRAAQHCGPIGTAELKAGLLKQAAFIEVGDYDKFGVLDHEFHQSLCDIAQVPFAFDVIKKEMANVDRLCLLSPSDENHMAQLLKDHQEIANCVSKGDADGAVGAGMIHLSRLDGTIAAITEAHGNYFDP